MASAINGVGFYAYYCLQRTGVAMNIIELAQECQLIGMRPHLDGIYQEALEKFAKLVAAQEREACAKLCDEVGKESLSQWPYRFANMIRARGEA